LFDVYGIGRTAILQLDIDGDVKGSVFLRGTPTYASASQGQTDVLTIQGLDFSVETKSVLTKATDWLLHPDLVSALRGAAIFPLAAEFG
jgi:hypothetical protein